MSRFVIQGGRPVAGRFRAPGNKNAALPMLAACLLTDEPVQLLDVPMIEDVRVMLAMLEQLGVAVTCEPDGHAVRLHANRLRPPELSRTECGRVRASILFAGPLCARSGAATLYPPGGDVIGRRRLDTHFFGLGKLGVEIEATDRYRLRCARPLMGTRILLDEASVTATENIVMAAVLARGETLLMNAACEPSVADLCRMLEAMGARIEGVGTNQLRIAGVDRLHGVTHRVGPDFVAAGSYIVAAVATGGALTVENVQPDDFEVLERAFDRLNVHWRIADGVLTLPAGQVLQVRDDLGSAVPKIEDGVWPNFPSDLLSAIIVLATQARGTVMIFEKLFESRLYFVDHLIGMGARIVQCDPHRLVISGPARLQGTRVSSPDIRAGMALILAALCAGGETIVQNAESIDRGYERVDEQLRALGAAIERVAEGRS